MKSYIVVPVFLCALAAGAAWGQSATQGPAGVAGLPGIDPAMAAPRDKRVIKAGAKTPDLTPDRGAQTPKP